jgi:dTDP-4-amino-4,6-dideoxygalactose transaminase
MKIPPMDLGRAERRIASKLDSRWRRLRQATAFVGGAEVADFEETFAAYLGAAGAVGVANGTDALTVALRCLDVAPGDEVIVPAFTFIATGGAVVLAGATPVFADVEPATLNLDPRSAAERITDRTVGIIGVHLYGRPFDVEGLDELCERHGLWLLEDAAQAQGAAWKGRKAGTFGRLATWSFYPSKNLGAFGDAGAVTGMDPELVERVRRVANHGRSSHYFHTEVGTNSRLDAVQAAVLNCRLPLLEEDNERRRQIAHRYTEGLAGLGDLELLEDREGALAVYHQFTLRTSRRDELKEHLAEAGVGTAVYYPHPLHLQPALERWAAPGVRLPVAEAAAQRVLSLPMFPELTDEEAGRVVAAVRDFYGA